MRKNIFFAVPLMVAVLISACADSGNNNNNNPPPAKSYNITGKIDYAGKTISSAKVCLDVNNDGLANDNACVDAINGEYTFTSSNNPAYYPLVAFIKEDTSAAINAKITVDNSDYDSILYAPRGKTETISITTTLAKSLMDKNSALKLTDAETQAEEIVKKAKSPATVLTVYNNALSSGSITDISTSIRGLVNVITDKLIKETSITDKTTITVSQEEVNTANDEISKADEEQPQEPQEPVTPDDSTKTPLEMINEMLSGAEIKNSAERPVGLNNYIDTTITLSQNEIGISKDAFGKFAGFDSEWTFTSGRLFSIVDYKETNWPSDSKLGFEVLPNDAFDGSGIFDESKNGYLFRDTTNEENANNPCNAGGIVNGIFYKAIIDDAIFTAIENGLAPCVNENGGFNDQGQPNNIEAATMCYTKLYYQNRDKFKIEKWYWTIDTTKVDMCSK